jgi:hypothetical protein
MPTALSFNYGTYALDVDADLFEWSDFGVEEQLLPQKKVDEQNSSGNAKFFKTGKILSDEKVGKSSKDGTMERTKTGKSSKDGTPSNTRNMMSSTVLVDNTAKSENLGGTRRLRRAPTINIL